MRKEQKLQEPKPTITFFDFIKTSSYSKSFDTVEIISKNKKENFNMPSKMPGKHKALGNDCCPDEIIEDNYFLKLLHSWATRKLNGEDIEPIYNVGKLILLSKNSSPFPAPNETRPIIVFSVVRKYLERIWLDRYSSLLWDKIGIL